MDPKARKPRDKRISDEELHACQERDMTNNLHNNTLWLWAVKAAHIFLEWRTTGVMDPILH